MNNIKNILKTALVLIAFTAFTSCDEGGDPEQEATNTGKFAGWWWVNTLDSDGGIAVEHALTATYNTAANDNTMWIDDNPEHNATPNGWWLKAKITMNPDGTFYGISQPNLNDPGSTVIITDGLISFGTGISKGGHVVNSISFKAEFSYDPGTILTFEGTQWTGFLEDEY